MWLHPRQLERHYFSECMINCILICTLGVIQLVTNVKRTHKSAKGSANTGKMSSAAYLKYVAKGSGMVS